MMQSITANRRMLLTSESVWLCAIIAVGGALRLYGLGFQSLWYDEGLQYYVATQNSIGELFYQRRSFHPPLSFIINHVFLLLGESDFVLRLPSALFGIASLPLLYILARDLTSERDAVFAVLILAISPFHIWYSQEGRMYSQLMFFSLLSSVLLMETVRRDDARWWIYYVLAAAAGVYTHVFMGLALVAQFVWVSLFARRHLRAMIVSGATIAILFLPWALLLPWVGNFARGVSNVGLTVAPASGGRAGFTLLAVPYTLFVYSAGFSLGPTIAELHSDRGIAPIINFFPSISVVITVFVILLGTGTFAVFKRFGARTSAFCLLGLFIPLAGAVAYSMTPRATYNVRYTVIAFPYFCVLIGIAVAFLARANKAFGPMAMAVVMSISVASLYNHFANPRYAKEDIRSAVNAWRQAGGEGPLLAIGSRYTTLRYVDTYKWERVFSIGYNEKNVVAAIDEILSSQKASSAYVVLARDWGNVKERAIRKGFAISSERSFPDARFFRIFRPTAVQISDTSSKFVPSRQP